MNLNRTQILRVVFFAVCFSGCVYQISYVSQQYFAYRTTTRVESQLQDVVPYPALVLCTRIIDFLNVSDEQSYDLSNLSIAQLHALTPAANQTIDSCLLRIDNNAYYKMHSTDECYKYFTVKRLIVGDNVCYQFHPKDGLNYSINHVANAFNFSYFVYDLVLSQPFNQTTELYMPSIYPLSGDNESIGFPVHSRKFGERFLRYKDESWIVVRPTQEIFTLRPPPFDTQCVENSIYCKRDCLIRTTINTLNRFPNEEPADEYLELKNISSHLKVLSKFDLIDETKKLNWKKIRENCEEKCQTLDCQTAITTNVVYPNEHIAFKIPLCLTVSVPASYPRTVTSIPQINWIQYVSEICNSISIWLGFSVISVNPLKHVSKIPVRVLAKKFVFLTYYILCILGFLYQSGELLKDYAKYQTTMTIELSTADSYPYKSLGFCLNYHELLDRSNYSILGLAPSSIEAFANWEKEYSALTVKQIIDLTPSDQSMITSCGVRNDLKTGFKQLELQQCLDWFSVEKTVRGENLCYFYVPRKALRYNWTEVATSYHDTGQVYEVTTSIGVNRSILGTVISYEAWPDETLSNKLPFESRNFAHETILYPNSVITVSSETNYFLRLPPPYDTMCRHKFYFQKCLQGCFMSRFGNFRLPYFSYIINYPDLKILSYEDIRNQTISDITSEAFRSCSSECVGHSCEQTISFTSSETHFDENQMKLGLIAVLPSSPTVNIIYRPSTPLFSLFMCISNCFGIWFGWSMLSINPISLWNKGVNIGRTAKNTLTVQHSKGFGKLFIVICFIGFIWQANVVTVAYFSYKTFNRVEVFVRDVYRFPSINVCFRYEDFMKSQPRNKSQMTIQEIFGLTPEPIKVLAGCRYRDETTGEMTLRDENDCNQNFSTTKYVVGANICFVYHSQLLFSLSTVTSSSSMTGLVYELLLHEDVNKAQDLAFYWFMQPIGYKGNGRASVSRMYPFRVFRDFIGVHSVNYFILQGVNHNITLLPEPYDTQCLPRSVASSCYSMCFTDYMESLGKVPLDEVISDPVPLLMLSEEDLKNRTFQEKIQSGKESCHSQCFRQPCSRCYSIPQVAPYWKPMSDHSGIVIASGTPASYGFVVKSYPNLTLIEFLNDLAVSACIWFGVSFLSLPTFPSNINWRKVKNEKWYTKRLNSSDRHGRIRPRIYCPCSNCQSYFKRFKTNQVV